MTGQKKATTKLVECVAVRNLCCDDQVKAGKPFTCTQEQFNHFESVGAAVKKSEAV
jgi:hypothetical protein